MNIFVYLLAIGKVAGSVRAEDWKGWAQLASDGDGYSRSLSHTLSGPQL